MLMLKLYKSLRAKIKKKGSGAESTGTENLYLSKVLTLVHHVIIMAILSLNIPHRLNPTPLTRARLKKIK